MRFDYLRSQLKSPSSSWLTLAAVFFALLLIVAAAFAKSGISTGDTALKDSLPQKASSTQVQSGDIFDRLVEQCEERAAEAAQKERAQRGLFNFPGSLTASQTRMGWLKYSAPDNRFSIAFPSATWKISPGAVSCDVNCNWIQFDLYPTGIMTNEEPWTPALRITWDSTIESLRFYIDRQHVTSTYTQIAGRSALLLEGVTNGSWYGPAEGRVIFVEDVGVRIDILDGLEGLPNVNYEIDDNHYAQEIDEVLETLTFE